MGKKRKAQGESTERLSRIQRRFSVVLYMLEFAALGYPWMMVGEKKYSVVTFALKFKRDGIDSLVQQAGIEPNVLYEVGVKVNLGIFAFFVLVGIFYLATVFARKNWNINIVSLLTAIAVLYAGTTPYMMLDFCSNYTEGILCIGAFMVVAAVEFIGRKVIENWDVTATEADEYHEKERREKEERKERLYFPGKYKKLFYRVIWKNFRRNLKDYTVLLVCNALVFGFVLTGFGMQKLTAQEGTNAKMTMTDLGEWEVTVEGGAKELPQSGLPSGAGEVLLKSIVELGAVGLFMLVLLLLYYLRKRIPEYGVFKTLGIRRKTMYFCMGLELGIGTILSLVIGGVAGTVLIAVFQKNIGGIEGSFLSPLLLLKAVAVMLVIYLVTFFVTHDLFVGFRMGSSLDLQVMKERMPRKFHIVVTAAGLGLCALMVYWYGMNGNFENIQILGGCLAGLYLVLRFGISGYLVHVRKKKGALSKLLRQHPFYHKSRSAVWYMFGLCVLQVCILAVFSVQLFSVSLVTDKDALFPYDLVMCASAEDGEDMELLEKMRQTAGVETLDYPMFRVSGTDATERSENNEMSAIRSQNIGISESTFHALKKAQDPDYIEKSLGLDDEGESIYIVHQQNKATKARPIDYKSLRSTPYLYTGPVCIGVDEYSPRTSFSRRRIAGEEVSGLIGALCQGERENLVVFSDTYFEKAKDIWKETNPYDGEVLKPEERAEYAEVLNQGPTRLIVAKADDAAIESLKPDLDAFRQRHRSEEAYDAKVKSYYLKKDVMFRMDAELNMQKTMAKLLIFIFFAAELLLLGIKMMTEKKMNVRRTEFLNCMGMRKKERRKLVRWEMGVYYSIVALCSAGLSTALLLATFHARIYTAEDIKMISAKLLPFGVSELAALGILMWVLTEWNIRQVEKKTREA